MRVLIVEDDAKMAGLIRRGLCEEGVAADTAVRGEDRLEFAAANEYDAVVLDIMLPGIDGMETRRRLRSAGIWTPVLMVTALDAADDRVRGLDQSAHDYLVKPFSSSELLVRLRAVASRGSVERHTDLSYPPPAA
jgi:two-component system OmpR family response regulator